MTIRACRLVSWINKLIFKVRVFLIKVICFYDRYDFISKTNMDTLDCIFFFTSTSRHAIKLLFISYNIAFHVITLKYKAVTGATSVHSVDSASANHRVFEIKICHSLMGNGVERYLFESADSNVDLILFYFNFIFVCVLGGRVNLYNGV